MVLHIITGVELFSVNPETIKIVEELEVPYNRYQDKKWIQFCKEHRFHPIKDSRGKIYELYLQLCAEGLV